MDGGNAGITRHRSIDQERQFLESPGPNRLGHQRRSSLDQRLYPTRFRIFNGDKVTLTCSQHESFSSILMKVAKRKGIPRATISHYVIKLPQGEIFFDPSDTFFNFLRMCRIFDVFRDDRSKNIIPEAILIDRDDIGDSVQRRTRIASQAGQVHWKGFLDRMGSGRSRGWKRQYYVLQDNTLFFYNNEGDKNKQKPAIMVIPTGSCVAIPWPPMTLRNINKQLRSLLKKNVQQTPPPSTRAPKGTKESDLRYCFELPKEPTGSGGKFYFMTASKDECFAWIEAIYLVCFNRVKSIIVRVTIELLRRKSLPLEGIFRVSGSKEDILALKAKYAVAEYPDLTKVEDDHVLTGLFKMVLREMYQPLLTFDLYNEFLDAVSSDDRTVKVAAVKSVVKKMPPANRALLEYIIKFLHKVGLKSAQNKMVPMTIAIVMAPNLLRSRNGGASQMMDSHKINNAVQLMIEEHATMFATPNRTAYQTTKKKRVKSVRHKSKSSKSPPTSIANKTHSRVRATTVVCVQQGTKIEIVPEQPVEKEVKPTAIARKKRFSHFKKDTVIVGQNSMQEVIVEESEEDEGDEGDSGVPSFGVNHRILCRIYDWQSRQRNQIFGLNEKVKQVDQEWDRIWDVLYTTDSLPTDIEGGVEKGLVDQLQAVNDVTAALDNLHKTLQKLGTRARKTTVLLEDPRESKDLYAIERDRRGTFLQLDHHQQPEWEPTQDAFSSDQFSDNTDHNQFSDNTDHNQFSDNTDHTDHTDNEVIAEALYDLISDQEGDLTIKKGDRIRVLDRPDNEGWWKGQVIGRSETGFFPHNYVKIIPASEKS